MKHNRSLTRADHGSKILFLIPAVLITLFIQGCTVGPDYKEPEIMTPDAWSQRFTNNLTAGGSVVQKWWQGFDDPVLTGLIEESSRDNLDIKQAALRIRQARAMLSIADGRFDPQVDAVSSYKRSKASENGLAFTGNPDPTNLHSVGLDASWEIDLFGRISRTVESTSASHQASIENYYDMLVSLYAEIAINYAELRALQKRVLYAHQNIESQGNTLNLTQNRFDAELAPRLDIEQARLNLANTKALIPDLRILENNALNRLAVLTGQYPSNVQQELRTAADIPAHSDIIEVGLPVDLIRQRPDIRKAERQLAAEVAKVGAVTADLYPAFSLSGTFAYESADLDDLTNTTSRTYGFGPSMRWNIFSGSRIRSNIALQKLIADESYLQYEKTVLQAVEEVENAMVEYTQVKNRTNALAESVAASEKSTILVEDLYRNGLTDFQNVLDMQRTLSQQQDKLAQSQGDIIKSLVRIYKALGGGWYNEEDATPLYDETRIKDKLQ